MDALDALCRSALGAGIGARLFHERATHDVHGLRLADGREVVVKLHGPRTSPAFLSAVAATMRALHDAGFPAPEPLAGPTAHADGHATFEALVDRGERPDARDPPQRAVLAAGLARLVALARPLPGLEQQPLAVPAGTVFPQPLDGELRLDTPGGEWIDAIAAAARPVRDRPIGEPVVGHLDWRAEHVRLDGGALSAVYDWDSLGVVREPLLIGTVAYAFTVDRSPGGDERLPTPAEQGAFVADYERARGRRFSPAAHEVIRAAVTYTLAFTARCELAAGIDTGAATFLRRMRDVRGKPLDPSGGPS